MVTVRRIAPHQDVTRPGHAGAYFGTNERLNVARPGSRQAGAVCNQLAGVYITGAGDFDFQVCDLPIGGDVA